MIAALAIAKLPNQGRKVADRGKVEIRRVCNHRRLNRAFSVELSAYIVFTRLGFLSRESLLWHSVRPLCNLKGGPLAKLFKTMRVPLHLICDNHNLANSVSSMHFHSELVLRPPDHHFNFVFALECFVRTSDSRTWRSFRYHAPVWIYRGQYAVPHI